MILLFYHFGLIKHLNKINFIIAHKNAKDVLVVNDIFKLARVTSGTRLCS